METVIEHVHDAEYGGEIVSARIGEAGDGLGLREWTIIAGERGDLAAGPPLSVGERVRVREIPSTEARS